MILALAAIAVGPLCARPHVGVAAESRLSTTPTPRVVARTLSNGMTLLVDPVVASPLAAVDLWVKAGSADDPPDSAGAAHLLEHMLFGGTRAHPGSEVDDRIEDLGGALEAETTRDTMHLSTTLPPGGITSVMRLLADVVQHASIPESALSREKGVVLDEAALAGTDPYRVMFDALNAEAFPGHPYGGSIPGDSASVLKIQRDTLDRERRRRMVGPNLTLVVVGPVDAAHIAREAETAFADLPATAYSRANLSLSQVRSRVGRERTVVSPDASAYVVVGYPVPGAPSPESVVAADLLYALLGGSAGRLQDALVSRGPARSVQAHYLTQRGPSLFSVAAACEPGDVNRVQARIDEVMSDLAAGSIPHDELAAARHRALSEHVFETETVSGRAATFGFYDAIGLRDLGLHYAERLSGVTDDSLVAAARMIFNRERAVRLVAMPRSPKRSTPLTGRSRIVPLPNTDTPDPGTPP